MFPTVGMARCSRPCRPDWPASSATSSTTHRASIAPCFRTSTGRSWSSSASTCFPLPPGRDDPVTQAPPSPSLEPRKRQRRTVAAPALDELPDRLAGQRSEGLSAELPGADEDEQAASPPHEDEEAQGPLQPSPQPSE